MILLDIRKYPDPVLRAPNKEVQKFDDALQELLTNMTYTMYHANGIGLAAPQVGVALRAAVIDVSPEGNQPLALINPKIVWSAGKTSSEEGCLSIPEYRDTIKRNERIRVEALDREGKPIEIEAEGILAICMQHEIDHLDGILFIDRLSRLKKMFFKRWHEKQQAQGE